MCPDHSPVLLDEEGCIREGCKKEIARRLDFASWLLAWERYSLGESIHECVRFLHAACISYVLSGAAAIGQMGFDVAMKHKAMVAEVAYGAKAANKSSLLGVLFDEVCR